MYGFGRILFVVRYMKLVYLTTKTIQTKLYTICSSHQLGLEVERSVGSTRFSFFYICLFVFVALRPMSTAMVIAGRSVHLTTLFPGQA